MLLSIGQGFAELGPVATWLKYLGGLPRLESFRTEARSEFIRATSEALPAVPVPPIMPLILSHEEAPLYADTVHNDSRSVVAWYAIMFGECRLIAKDLDLLSALFFLTQAEMDREYAIEKDPSTGRYQIVSGYSDFAVTAEHTFLHTHGHGIALPSEPDLVRRGAQAELWGQPWEYIYSRPHHEHQLSYIWRHSAHSFEIWFWRDRMDPDRGERTTSARNFRVHSGSNPESGDSGIDRLEVREMSLQEQTIGEWHYNDELYPDRNIREFWKVVLGP